MATAFFETYERLCRYKGMSDSAAAAEIGLSNSTVTSWKNGALPRKPTIKKVADYFGVTIDQMLGYKNIDKEKLPANKSGELTENDMKLLKFFRSLPPEKLKAILIAQDGPVEIVDE